ncbi:Translation initiation factor 2 [Klebsormidium nitens]|uniref:Translation initiation factor IF-2, chloroplastic n=1 Tax=Klebsormidium nitens TaxID=105231 RepID=A0A1Y1HPX6_KLENI|nr:Translation initiation factor 2 [Klebsormidium nitens]|eukprot:GAQ80685.1 Translation initiation factor 2 [Klebsormidium nitens]
MAHCAANALLQPAFSTCCACSLNTQRNTTIVQKVPLGGIVPFRAGHLGRPLSALVGKGAENRVSVGRLRVRAAGVEVETVEAAENAGVVDAPGGAAPPANKYKNASSNRYANGKAQNGSNAASDSESASETITEAVEEVLPPANGAAAPPLERKKKTLSGQRNAEGAATAPPRGGSQAAAPAPRGAWKRGDPPSRPAAARPQPPRGGQAEAKEVWTPKTGKRVTGFTPASPSSSDPGFDRPSPAAERPAVSRQDLDDEYQSPPRRSLRAETPARSPAASAEVQVWRPGQGQLGGPEGGGQPPPPRRGGGGGGAFPDQVLDDPSLLSRRPPPRLVGPPGGDKAPAKKRAVRKTGGAGRRGEEDENQRFIADNQIVIPGMPQKRIVKRRRRKGRAYKARMRALRDKTGQPVRAEIIEVGEEGLPVSELAELLVVNEAEVVSALFMKGIMATVNETLSRDAVKLVCEQFEVEVLEVEDEQIETMAKKTNEFISESDLEKLKPRPPVVTIMGHVDHGKTSLLDYIRKEKVAAGEAGGITQAIGAYRVPVEVEGETHTCVFLDTPGHEAFSAMRARGAKVTDIAVIVVAADDGVRPQTLEAISHAKAAEVPIVVAINKVDKDGASVEKVMQELSAQAQLYPEEWGGDVAMVPVSAKKGTGVDELLEAIMLVAEVSEFSANPDREAKGTVIEATLDRKRGPLATVVVQCGTLRRGDVMLCGDAFGKVRALLDHTGKSLKEAGPSEAVQVMGLSGVPAAGEVFEIRPDLDDARSKAEERGYTQRTQRLANLAGEGKITLQSLAAAAAVAEEGLEFGRLNLILKVDVAGSAEAIRSALEALPQDTIGLRFLLSMTGDVSISDIDLAQASEAVVLGFNVQVPPAAEAHSKETGIEVKQYNVIYDLVDDIRKAMEGMMEPEEERIPIGTAEVKAVFPAGSGKAAGCIVTEGKLVKGCTIAVIRKKKEVYFGKLDSLRRVKELAKQVEQGNECGANVSGFNEWAVGDTIQAFNVVKKQRTLESASAVATKAMAMPAPVAAGAAESK